MKSDVKFSSFIPFYTETPRTRRHVLYLAVIYPPPTVFQHHIEDLVWELAYFDTDTF